MTDTEILATTPPAPAGTCAVSVRTRFGQEGGLANAYRYLTATSQPPTAHDGAAETFLDSPVTITLSAVDPEGDPLTFSIVDAPDHGTLSPIAGNHVTYTPDGSHRGADAFTFVANDGNSDSNPAVVSLTVHPRVVTIDVAETIHTNDGDTVEPALAVDAAEAIQVSDAVTIRTSPVAVDATAVVPEDSSTQVAPTALEADGDAVTLTIVAGPAHGTVSPPPGTAFAPGTLVTYTPAPNFFGGDSFTFKATDAEGDSNIGTVTITVTPMSDAPFAAPDGPFGVTEGGTLTVPAPGVLLNDGDLDLEPLTARLVTSPGHGTLTLDPDGGFTYHPAASFSGTDTFTYVANDGAMDSAVATVVIQVAPSAGREVRIGLVPPGESLTTDIEGDGATAEDAIETTVLTPQGGEVEIEEAPAPPPLPTAFTFLPWQVHIAAPPAPVLQPLLLTFLLDGSLVPAAAPVASVAIFRDGVEVPPCTAGAAATPDPCVAARLRAGDDVLLRVRTSRASTWTFGVARATDGLAAGTLRPLAGGRAAFTATRIGDRLLGALTFTRKRSVRFVAWSLSAFAVEADGRSAWFAGVGAGGSTFLAYARDGRDAEPDLFRLWIAGVEQTGDGRLARGRVTVTP
jgi:hypothetical protein